MAWAAWVDGGWRMVDGGWWMLQACSTATAPGSRQVSWGGAGDGRQVQAPRWCTGRGQRGVYGEPGTGARGGYLAALARGLAAVLLEGPWSDGRFA